MWFDSCITLVACYRAAGAALAALLGLAVLIGAAFNVTAAAARDPWWDRLLGIVDVDGGDTEDGEPGVGSHRA
jgi:hypothetical protein